MRVSFSVGCLLGVVSAACNGPTYVNDGGLQDAGIFRDAGTPDSGPYCLPLYDTGVVELDDAGCPPLPPHPDLLDQALAQWGLDRCTFSNRGEQLVSGPRGFDGYVAPDPFTLPYYYLLHDHPLLVPSFVRNLTTDLDTAAASTHPVSRTIATLAARLGKTLSVCDDTAALAPDTGETQPLAHAVAALISANGGSPDEAGLETAAQGIPFSLQGAVATLVNRLGEAPAALTAYLATSGSPNLSYFGLKLQSLPFLFSDFSPSNGLTLNPAVPADLGALAALDITPLASYAAQLALTVESLDLGRFRDTMGFVFSAQTPLGAVVVSDGRPNRYEPTDPNLAGNILLLLDTGGDDVYRVPVGANQPLALGINAPVALAIDLGGSDDYGYEAVPDPNDVGRLPSDGAGRLQAASGIVYPDAGPIDTSNPADGPISLSTTGRQGSGIVGIGMLFDYGAEADHYQSLRMSQGFGTAGIGVLFDEGGNDTYEGEALVQGAASFGIGLLLDLSGDDTRITYTQSQGYAFTGGFGALVDLSGDDAYLANVGAPELGGDPLYANPQLPQLGNTSMSQGAATGFRYTNSLTELLPGAMSGGLAILRDAQGNDRYLGSVYAQATAYYLGFGMLVDSAGNDQYDALQYAQGNAVHNSLSFFWDESGDDRYNQNLAPVGGILGEGDDLAVTIHVDNGGNDAVNGSGNTDFGNGVNQGIGIYINNGGTDTFNGDVNNGNDSFGEIRNGGPEAANYYGYGIFLKAGGHGIYSVEGESGQGSHLGFPAPGTSRIQAGVGPWCRGIFIDDPDAGSVQLP